MATQGQLSRTRVAFAVAAAAFLPACTNDPYRPGETSQPTYFSSFATPPTKLDPATSYYAHEGRIIDQIYEPPFTYHYLKRPYELIPLTAEAVPAPAYFDTQGRPLLDPDPPAEQVGRVEYTVRLRPNIRYQNHPCFARDDRGQPFYRDADPQTLPACEFPTDLPRQATRELQAGDYALQVRRLADPRLASPVFSTLAACIQGLDALQTRYKEILEQERAARKAKAGPGYNQEQDERDNPIVLDYLAPDCPGIQVLDERTFRLVLTRKYPQILYWMCMHFFGPMPREALEFYNFPAIRQRQFSINRCPVGTGPYYLKMFRPNEVIVLEQNPNYHEDTYPAEGMPEDAAAGLLADAGQRLPFIRRQELHFEKEDIPAWNKFLQGYTDVSAIANDVFDQAIRIRVGEGPLLTEDMSRKGIRLVTGAEATLWYTSFNLMDETVGGLSPEKCKLRQAISIALDYNEYLDIFYNGRGIAAQGPLPPGIFGYREGPTGVNPYVDQWEPARNRAVRQPIETARKLLAEAGFPGGMTPQGEPLTLYYDHAAGGETFFRAYFEWTRGRLDLLGIRLRERATDLSRYREKQQQGNWQIASGGWLADYPDPENFLFLFYGPNGKVKTGGPNMANYESAEFDTLFRQAETMLNTPARMELIDRMQRILQRDAPVVWQFYPVSYMLCHEWYRNIKPHEMSYNTVKFRRIDPDLRVRRQKEWNRPVFGPLLLGLGLLVLALVPAAVMLYRRERGKTPCKPT